jgi:CHASE1-domain containing sensor protein
MMAYIRPWAAWACVGCLTASTLAVAPLLATLQRNRARAQRQAVEQSADPALERTRERVKMLDDL